MGGRLQKFTATLHLNNPVLNENLSKLINAKGKKQNLFDNNVSKFVNSDILEKQINQEFEQKLSNVKLDDPFRAVKIKNLQPVKSEEMEALNCLKEKEKKG